MPKETADHLLLITRSRTTIWGPWKTRRSEEQAVTQGLMEAAGPFRVVIYLCDGRLGRRGQLRTYVMMQRKEKRCKQSRTTIWGPWKTRRSEEQAVTQGVMEAAGPFRVVISLCGRRLRRRSQLRTYVMMQRKEKRANSG
ncbi:hypothetical protein CEXT_281011 [Caerostris extrusa]|uniref:Uncharacterized protein n=1 Tax=Caerostris extrusa TaxID=172846 RepID=A0AAV4M8S7_CAEEX|nr:hypothetical protein CEXT_281011 [Caerostris extrusa]